MPNFDFQKIQPTNSVGGEYAPEIPQLKDQITFRDYAPYMFDILPESIPQGIASFFKGAGKGAAKTIVGLGETAMKFYPRKYQELYKTGLKPELDKALTIKTEELPGAITEQIAEVALGSGLLRKAMLSTSSFLKFSAHYPKIYNMLSTGVTGTALGQIRMPSDADYKERLKQGAIDFVSWTAWGAVGGIPAKAWYAYAPAYGAIGYASSRLEGRNNEESLTAGLTSAVVGSLFHLAQVPKSTQRVLYEDADKVLRKYQIETASDLKDFRIQYHPDVSEGRVGIPAEEAEKIFQQVGMAWDIKTKAPIEWQRGIMQEMNDLWRGITNRPIPAERVLVPFVPGAEPIVPKVPAEEGIIPQVPPISKAIYEQNIKRIADFEKQLAKSTEYTPAEKEVIASRLRAERSAIEKAYKPEIKPVIPQELQPLAPVVEEIKLVEAKPVPGEKVVTATIKVAKETEDLWITPEGAEYPKYLWRVKGVKEVKPEVFVEPEPLKTTLNVQRTETPKNISELSNEWKIAVQENNITKMTGLANQWKEILGAEEAKPPKPPRGGIVANFYDYIRPHFTIPPDKVVEGIKELSKGWLVSAQKIFGKMGKSGKELGRLFGLKEAESRISSANMEMDMKKLGLDKLTPQEEWSVIAIAENLPKIPVDNEKVRAIAQLWKEQQGVINEAIGGLDVMVTGADGAIASYHPIENYFVHFIRPSLLAENEDYQKEVIDFGEATGIFENKKEAEGFVKSYEKFIQSGEKDKEFLGKLAEKNKKSIAEVESLWRRFIAPNVPKKFGPLEKMREFNFPLYDPRLKTVLPEFYNALWDRVNHIKHFGQKDGIAKDLINKIGEDGYDWQFANRVFDIATGKGNVDTRVRGATQVLLDLQTLKLVLSAILQPTQFVQITVVGGWKNMIKGITDVTNSAKREDVLRAGVALNRTYYEAVSGFAKGGIGEKITKVFGLTAFDKIMRVFAGNAGPYVLEDCLKDPFDKFNKLRLLDLLITPENVERVLSTGKPTPQDIKMAQFRMAKITQYTYRPEDLPPHWKENIFTRIATLFKSYGVQHAEFLEKYVAENPKRIPTWLLAVLLFVTPIATARRLIRGRQITVGGILKDTFALAFLGIWSEIIEATQYRGGIAHWVLGPLYGDITSGLEYTFRGNWKQLTDLTAPYMAGMVLPPEVVAALNLLYQPIKKRFIFPYQEAGRVFPSLKR